MNPYSGLLDKLLTFVGRNDAMIGVGRPLKYWENADDFSPTYPTSNATFPLDFN